MPMRNDRPAAPHQNVVNLMDALKRSIAESGKAPKSKKRGEGQREMLLPIAGKGQKETAAARSAGKQRKAG